MKAFHPLLLLLGLAIAAINSGCSTSPAPQNTGDFIDNSLITARIKARLIDDRITSGYRIKVTSLKGVIYLSGEVNSLQDKNHATEIAKSVEGVKEIENNLIIISDE